MVADITGENGKRLYSEKKYLKAAEAFAQSAREYRVAGDALMEAEMKNNQSVALLQGGDAHGSLRAAAGTDEVFEKAGDVRRQGMALANQAAALEGLKQKEEAIRVYQLSAGLLKRAGETEMHSQVMTSITNLQVSKGKLTDAVMSMQAGMIGTEKKPGFKNWLIRKLMFLKLWR